LIIEIKYRKAKRNGFTGLPYSLNRWQAMHWSYRDRITKAWKRIVWELLLGQSWTCLDRATVKITVYKAGVQNDVDNICVKPILDALTYCAVILDDKPEVIGTPIIKQVRVKHLAEQKTIVEVIGNGEKCENN